jgi:hypothetical protein
MLKWFSLLLGALLGLPASLALAAACSDADLSAAVYDRLSQGMAFSQASTLLPCDYVNLGDEVQSLGITTQNYRWSSANRSISLTFRLGTLFAKNRGGLTSDVATYSSPDSTLTMPKITVGGTTYTNARLLLPPGGAWSVLGAGNGVATAQDTATSIFSTSDSTLYIPSLALEGASFANVWLYLPFNNPWSILGVGMLTQPPLPNAGSGAPTVTLALTDTVTGQTVTTITSGNSARLVATVRDIGGAPVPNAVVIFATDSIYGTFTPAAGTALSDASGVASVTLNAGGTASGATTVTASTQVADATVTGALNYAVGATNITLGALSFGSSPLAAYGTTSVSVTVLNNGSASTAPVPVAFTSACAGTGKAFLTSSVATVNGVATASYRDNGCNSTDTVTATLSNGTSASGNLVVSSPSAGSLQFVSVSPATIGLRGSGGSGRQETATVVFRVVDNNNNPVGGKAVSFGLSTTLGGLTLSSSTAVSDPATGQVFTNVIAGNMSTVVRVTATADGLTTQSDLLTISTGLPAQDSFSLSASTHSIEGWSHDGTQTTITARLADHFHNPVPDGTAVYFTSEGASVAPSCATVGGVCSVTFTSQALRPNNGRVTVTARAIGEEAFTDLNSNGVADSTSEMIDANNASTDMGEAYVDYNENYARDANEPYFDFNGSGGYDGPDGKFNGLLCTTGTTICSSQRSIDVRGSQVIVLSGSYALITMNGNNSVSATLPACQVTNGQPVGGTGNITTTIVDERGNAMPAGTQIAFTVMDGTIIGESSFTVVDGTGCRSGYSGCPASAAKVDFGDYVVRVQSNGQDTGGGACGNAATSLNVKVTTPKGAITSVTW